MHLSGSVLIKNAAYVLTMNSTREVLRDTSIAIHDGKITQIGCFEDIFSGEQIILDGKGKIALPGFINAHAHGLSILTRGGLSQDRRLRDWLVNINQSAGWEKDKKMLNRYSRAPVIVLQLMLLKSCLFQSFCSGKCLYT